MENKKIWRLVIAKDDKAAEYLEGKDTISLCTIDKSHVIEMLREYMYQKVDKLVALLLEAEVEEAAKELFSDKYYSLTCEDILKKE